MTSQKRGKVLLAMSGGVDSSVAAALLLEEGYEVMGVFMCLGTVGGGPDSDTRGCCSPQDAADARQVAQKLGIPLHVLNLADEFQPIIENFIQEYGRGRTPNPCIHCNTRIKFGRLLQQAASLGFGHVATGHYARLALHDGSPAIFRKVNRSKDQSYVLFGIPRDDLGRLLFPLGAFPSKDLVRARARDLGLKTADKPDSQEVCFVPENDYVEYLRDRAPEAFRPGKIVATDGRVLGTHDGFVRFTIGQRKGLQFAKSEPMYVSAIDASTGTVVVGKREDLIGTRLTASSANWHADLPDEFECTAQIRYNHSGAPARVRRTGATTFEASFPQGVLSITPGQAVVCYDGDRLLGGGWID